MSTKKSNKLFFVPLFLYQLFLFCLQLAIIFACMKYAQVIYDKNILPDKHVQENFTETSCTVLAKKLTEKGRLLHRYRADFQVEFTAQDLPYQVWVTGNGLDQAFFRDRAAQEETLAQFEVGTSYPCWYNPITPQIAVLVLRHDWASTLPLAIPVIISLVALFYLLKGLIQFFGTLLSTFQNRSRFKK